MKNDPFNELHRLKDSTFHSDLSTNKEIVLFTTNYSAYLAKFNIDRNKTAIVLLGFDKNDFNAFQKSLNLPPSNKDIFFNEKVIYIDHNLVSFSGYIDLFKNKETNNSRKSSSPNRLRKLSGLPPSSGLTPSKRRKSSGEDKSHSDHQTSVVSSSMTQATVN